MSPAPRLKVSPGLDESIDMGPAVSEAQLRPTSATSLGKDEGRSRMRQPPRQALTSTASSWNDGLRRCDRKMRTGRNLGPVVSIIPCDGLEDARRDRTAWYGLSSALYTKDVNRAFTRNARPAPASAYINAPTIQTRMHHRSAAPRDRRRPSRRRHWRDGFTVSEVGGHRLLRQPEGADRSSRLVVAVS
jgi:aldehyde dehydrogenase (NAD+)